MPDAIDYLARSIKNVDSRLRDLSTREKALQAWVAPTLLNSWADAGAPYSATGYWKDPWGIVHLRGALNTGVSGTVMFVLPAKYRPQGTLQFRTAAGGATSAATVTIDTSGNVTGTTAAWPIHLEVVTFRAYA